METTQKEKIEAGRERDLILGVLGGPWVGKFGYPGIEAYVESIKRSGFAGRKVMLCWSLRPEVRTTLLEYGFEVVDLPRPRDPFFHARMRVCAEYLRDHYKEFRYIFWLDIKDLILQSDPSVWMEKHIGNHGLIGSTECVTIEQEETNQIWSRTIVGEKEYQEIKHEEVINGGTWAGKSEIMAEVFYQVHLRCYSYQGPFPPCQAQINYVMRQSPFKEELYIPRWSESFAACLHPVWWIGARYKCAPFLKDFAPVIDIETATLYPGMGAATEGHDWIDFNPYCTSMKRARKLTMRKHSDALSGVECVTNPGNEPFCIVHGYDRDFDMQTIFEYKYRYAGRFNLEDYKRHSELVIPIERRGLRAVQRPRIDQLAFGGVTGPSTRTFVRGKP
jgi:hypothetical protein